MLLAGGAAGAVLFVVTFLADGATRPGYDVRRHTVSHLALGDRGWVQTANFVVCGSLVALGGIGAALALPPISWGSVWGPLLILVFGVALVASGLFGMDPMRGYPPGTPEADPEQPSRAHHLHDLFGMLVFAGLPLLPLWYALTLSDLAWQLGSGLAAGTATLLVMGFGAAWERDAAHTGLLQRAALVVGLGWLAALCVHLSP